MKKITLIVCSLCFSMGLFPQIKQQDSPQLDKLKKLFKADSVQTQIYIELPNGIKALTVVFRETGWVERFPSQQALVAVAPKDMRKFENNIQVWLISLASYPDVDGSLKKIIPPSKYPSEEKREMAFVGKGQGFAWFVFAPITKWIYIPGLLQLQGGDDPVDAALRGFATITAWEYMDYLGKSLPKALPQIDKAVENEYSARYSLIQSVMCGSNNEEVIQWLIRHSSSIDQNVADAARYCLVEKQNREFMPMYRQWLTEDAGKRDVSGLLRACKAVQMPDLINMLPVVLKSPTSIYEYRLAFEMERELKGQNIPKDLLESEKTICIFGQKRGVDETKVNNAGNQIIASADHDAVATIGLSLAVYFKAKANWDDYDVIHKAGVRILRNLPNEKGRALVEQLARSCKEYDKDRLDEIIEVLRDEK